IVSGEIVAPLRRNTGRQGLDPATYNRHFVPKCGSPLRRTHQEEVEWLTRYRSRISMMVATPPHSDSALGKYPTSLRRMLFVRPWNWAIGRLIRPPFMLTRPEWAGVSAIAEYLAKNCSSPRSSGTTRIPMPQRGPHSKPAWSGWAWTTLIYT